MAGITNAPFRAICASHGAPLCVSEMLAAGLLNEGNARTRLMARFTPSDSPRSVQLYGVDPAEVRHAAAWLVGHGAQHIDLNFGCPVRKVTAKGGGAAVPARPRLLGQLVAAAVAGAGGHAPVTVKMRTGISDSIQTYLEAGRVAEAEGAAAISLHARTAVQLYDPPADWQAVSRLVAAVSIPVIGNGDVFEAGDALRLMRQTGCAGVLVGRACLGRPWLFTELADVFAGRPPRPPPPLSGALQAADQHLRALLAWDGDASEIGTLRAMRKMVPLYLHGFRSAVPLRQVLLAADSLAAWDAAIAAGKYDPEEPFAVLSLRHARLKGAVQANRQRISLPPGWLDDQQLDKRPLHGAGVSCEG